MNKPDQSPQPDYEQPPVETLRMVGDRAMRVTVIPPENPEDVKTRDRISTEVIGGRPMIGYNVPDTKIGRDGFAHGRVAPKYTN